MAAAGAWFSGAVDKQAIPICQYTREKHLNHLPFAEKGTLRASDQGSSRFLLYIQRVLGLLIVLSCIILCGYQLHDRVSLYLREPTSIDFVVTRNESIIFPSVTFCSSLGRFMDAIKYDMKKKVNQPGESYARMWYIPFAKYGLDLDKLWKDNAITSSAINVTINSKLSSNLYGTSSPFTGIMKTVDTPYCNCLTFTPNKALELNGRTTVIFKIDQKSVFLAEEAWYQDIVLHFKIHDADVSQRHESMGYVDFIPDDNLSTLTLVIKRFSYQKKKRFHCLDQLEALALRQKCIDDVIQNADIPCRYPFINSRKDLKQCTTLDGVWNATLRMYKIYDEPAIARCHHNSQICQETTYSYPSIINKNITDARYVRLEVIIQDNNFEMVTESFTYSFAALLSDIGGSLGFFLGLSVLTLFDALQKLTHCCVKFWQKKTPNRYLRK